MSTLNLNKATICTPSNICATVYGETAKVINAIAVGVVVFIAAVLIARAVS